MRLPSDETCARAIEALEDEPNLSTFESEFVESNLERRYFTDAQKEVVARLLEKFDI